MYIRQKRVEGNKGLNSRTFSMQKRGRTGQPTLLNTWNTHLVVDGKGATTYVGCSIVISSVLNSS